MKHSRKPILPVVLILAILAIAVFAYWHFNQQWQDQYRARVSGDIVNLIQTNPFDQLNVVVIVIDGLRWEEGIGAEDRYIPHIWNDLRPAGTLLTNYRISSPTATTSVHTALLSGRPSTAPNDGHMRPVFPTMLEYYRDSRQTYVDGRLNEITRTPPGIFFPDTDTRTEVSKLAGEAAEFGPEKTALYLGKDLIYSLDRSSCGAFPDKQALLVDSLRDIEVEEYFRAEIPDVKPNMIFVNLGDVDECGHEAQWYYYVDAIRAADDIVWTMWQSLQELQKYRDKTLFIVTTDHGRHIPSRGGYPHHSCFCDGCRRAFTLMIGPGIRQGFVSDQPHTEADILPTVGAFMGVATPGATGGPVMEAFENPGSLPQPASGSQTQVVADDKAKVDNRDTEKLLLDSILKNTAPDQWGNNIQTAMLHLAMAARIDDHPDEVADWLQKMPVIDETAFPSQGTIADYLLAYPFIALGRSNESSGSTICFGYRQRGEDMFHDFWGAGIDQDWSQGDAQNAPMEQKAMMASMLAAVGNSQQIPEATRAAYSLLLKTLETLEGYDKVYTGDLNDFIDDYKYRQGPNEIFTQAEISMRDRMWLLWGIERVLAESNPNHVPDLFPLLERQYRLLTAFCSEWQDANSVIGGTGDVGESVDLPSQGLFLSSMANFKPWRRWELDALGYSPTIYATPLFDFPPQHFFFILGQANVLAGAWTARERLRLFVDDNGEIRDELRSNPAIYMNKGPDWILSATSLAYGLSRFEKADYNLFDLELYPIVHQ